MKQGLNQLKLAKMELFIETLTGTAFELRVSPFETIMSVKAKIQRLEGIPISHQHLIWQSVELEDDYCLHDYHIHSGATLKLVLSMRGGPINTRRIPVEDTALREMAEYMEANKDEILDKLPDSRNVTLLVFREGDQLNFFRVVDRERTVTPPDMLTKVTSYSVNEEEEEEEETLPKENVEENDKMKEKLDQLRVNMEKMSLTKKKRPKAPSSGRKSCHSGTHSGTHRQVRQLTNSGRPFSRTLNKNACLPPVGHTFSSPTTTYPAGSVQAVTAALATASPTASSSRVVAAEQLAEPTAAVSTSPVDGREASSVVTVMSTTSPVLHAFRSTEETGGEVDVPRSVTGHPDSSPNSPVSLSKTDPSLLAAREAMMASQAEKLEPAGILETQKRSPYSHHREMSMGSGFSRPTTSTRFHGLDRCKEFALESLSTGEARTMSGILRQASIEKLGTSHIGNLASSASKSRMGSFSIQEARIPTPESRLSARLRVSASRDNRIMSPTHRLPPVKAKKKATKRCYVCGKKTGLATSYQCRCGNNFCATHRYAESHDCTFDYKNEGRKLLEQSNPVVSAPKLPKI